MKDERQPFHEGEIAVQERTGERADAARLGAMLRDTITPPARVFLASQRTLAVGAVDDRGRPWCSLWLGAPGFVASADGRVVRVGHGSRAPAPDDPLRTLLRPGRDLGMLAIDLVSRRRLRVNGVVAASDDERLEVTVREAFPNCPKYIQRREVVGVPGTRVDHAGQRGERLDGERRSFVARIDTLFVASHHPTRGVDVSHRGGARGFVRVIDERVLRFPDYPGNGMFQSLGNFEVAPRAGVVMVDFDRGRVLSLTGNVTVSYGVEDRDPPTGGTGRTWDLEVEEWVDLAMPAGFGFRFIESSPFNPASSGSDTK
jgi:uncharacterized protein